MASETFLASFGLIGLRLVELYGIDPGRFAQQVGISSIEIPDARTRLPSALLDVAFEKAAQMIPDPAFALRSGECWHPSHLGPLGYGWLSSGSLSTALRRMARYTKLLGQRMASRCVEDPAGLRFIYDHGRGQGPAGPVMADFGLALVLSMCRTNYGSELVTESASLRRPAPDDPSPYERLFRCPVSFAAAEDALVFSRQVVERPLPTSNHELAVTFDAILAKQLGELDAAAFPDRCRTHLLQELTSGEPSEEGLARAMSLSRRTLQRKLGEHGLTYRSLVEKTRYDLALRYLDDPARSVTEITFLLGFSEQSAFSRAFKRWSGKAPSEYRSDAGA
jgi:AraC-like DNA-binding protein